MAPKRKAEKAAEPAAKSGRVTRSATRLTRSGARSSSVANFIELPNTTRKSPAKAKKAEVKGKGKGKGKGKMKEEGESSGAVKEDAAKTVVIVEHCKQCNSFKTRAIQVKEGLESSDLDVVVKLNPEKPRRGCFEIRLEDGDKFFISLLDLKRPFKRMKDLDMDKVISDIIEELSNDS